MKRGAEAIDLQGISCLCLSSQALSLSSSPSSERRQLPSLLICERAQLSAGRSAFSFPLAALINNDGHETALILILDLGVYMQVSDPQHLLLEQLIASPSSWGPVLGLLLHRYVPPLPDQSLSLVLPFHYNFNFTPLFKCARLGLHACS